MGRIFKSEDVIKIAEAVMIPDCVVRIEPQTMPESTLIEDVSDEEPVSEGENCLSEDECSYGENAQEAEEITNSELYQAEYEKLQIEREAILKQAEQIISAAQAESKSIIDNANEQVKSIFSSAMEEGYQEGVKAKQDEIDSCMLKINQYLAEMKMDQEEYFEEYASELKFLALEIAEKIVAQKLETDERILFPLVRSAVKTLRDVNWIKVEVSDRLKEVASELETVLSEAKSSQNIEVELRRDADPGTCVVHTAEGVIVASVLTQIENIREYFIQYKDSDDNEHEA